MTILNEEQQVVLNNMKVGVAKCVKELWEVFSDIPEFFKELIEMCLKVGKSLVTPVYTGHIIGVLENKYEDFEEDPKWEQVALNIQRISSYLTYNVTTTCIISDEVYQEIRCQLEESIVNTVADLSDGVVMIGEEGI